MVEEQAGECGELLRGGLGSITSLDCGEILGGGGGGGGIYVEEAGEEAEEGGKLAC